jgi:hypothetical protein
MQAHPFDGALVRSRTSLAARLDRWRSRRWAIARCAVAAAVAWWFAQHVVGHPTPFFAPVAAVVSLGTSYGQRLRRVAEVTIGVALGDLLAEARATDHLIRELQDAAAEGLDVVASSPFRLRHGPGLRTMAELVEPLDRALRSTRVLVRHTAVAAYHHRQVPKSYSLLALDLADAADMVADELAADRMAVAAREALMQVGEATGLVERADEMTAEVVLGQLRSVVVDLLLLTGMTQVESTEALPPPPRWEPTPSPGAGSVGDE